MTELPRALTSRTAYENDWMRVREDLVRWPGGHEAIYGVVEKPDSRSYCRATATVGGWSSSTATRSAGACGSSPQGSWPASRR